MKLYRDMAEFIKSSIGADIVNADDADNMNKYRRDEFLTNLEIWLNEVKLSALTELNNSSPEVYSKLYEIEHDNFLKKKRKEIDEHDVVVDGALEKLSKVEFYLSVINEERQVFSKAFKSEILETVFDDVESTTEKQ